MHKGDFASWCVQLGGMRGSAGRGGGAGSLPGVLRWVSPWSPGDAGKRETISAQVGAVGAETSSLGRGTAQCAGQSGTKDSEEEEEGAELAPQHQGLSWTR